MNSPPANEWKDMFDKAESFEEAPRHHEVIDMLQRPGWSADFKINDTDKGEKMLKSFKLLRMKGTYSEGFWRREETVIYNPVLSTWCRKDTPNTPALTTSGKAISPDSITNVRELLPKGFINILGEVEFTRMKLKDTNSRKRGKISTDQLGEGDGLLAFIAHRVSLDKKEEQRKKTQRKEAVQIRKGVQLLDDESSDEEEDGTYRDSALPSAPSARKPGGGATSLNATSGTNDSQQQQVKASLQQTQRLEEKRKKLATQGLGELAEVDDDGDDDIQNIIDLGDDAGGILTSSDIAKFIKQYITRSIVTAARKRTAVVCCTDTSGIMRALARGIHTAGAIRSHEMNGLAMTGKVPVLDYRAQNMINSDNDERCQTAIPRSEWFTHHVTVQSNTLTSTRIRDDAIIRLFDAAALLKPKTPRFPIPRQPSRVVGVVIGGSPEQLKFNLIQYAERKWPLLIIEGSGGYADIICSIIKKIEANSGGTASLDDYSNFLSNTDAATSQIISSGVCRIVPKGMCFIKRF